jgi:NADH-quinone oxidoreductase subunit L
MTVVLGLILLLPLLGAFFHAAVGRRCGRRLVEWVACGTVSTSFFLALYALLQYSESRFLVRFFDWFSVADLSARVEILYDPLAGLMAVMVTFVSSVVHVYSVAYMRDDDDYVRYFCFLNLFVFSMLVITLADNLLFLFLGWEGVGFCSYALIGFWYRDPANAAAGRKAFLLTRIGDVAFGIALGVVFATFGSLSIDYVLTHASSLTEGLATLIGLLLLWSAVGKSAQLPLAVWLPDAMAGPTPVSALIHAATMVTAGVYLLMRLFPVLLLSPAAMLATAVVGVVTALFASCSALAQTDIKRILAYSTISQLGYMFLAVGAGDIIGSMSYLLSHAFFKSLLFLAAGCIIQAWHEEHNVFAMGDRVRRQLPTVFWVFLVGACSLAALPPTGGFLNKDRVLLAAFQHPETIYRVLWALALVSSFITSLYTFRLFFLVFTGGHEADGAEVGPSTFNLQPSTPFAGGHEADAAPSRPAPIPGIMVVVLCPLAFLALISGYSNLPPVWAGKEWLGYFLAEVPGSVPHLDVSERMEWAVATIDGLLAAIALPVAYRLYGARGWLRREVPGNVMARLLAVVYEGFYLDRFYSMVLVRPYQRVARALWLRVDEGVVDRGLVGYGRGFAALGAVLRLWSNGRLPGYLAMILLGFSAILAALVFEYYVH